MLCEGRAAVTIMLYLRLYLLDGRVWTQIGVGYATPAEVQRVFEGVGPHLPEGTEGEPVSKEEVYGESLSQ
jgi:hypothetical protein